MEAAIQKAHDAGRIGGADVHQQLSAEVRRFAGIVTHGDADYRVLPELRRAAVADPRLEPIVEFVAEAQTPSFAPTGHGTVDGVHASFDRARELIASWR